MPTCWELEEQTAGDEDEISEKDYRGFQNL